MGVLQKINLKTANSSSYIKFKEVALSNKIL